VLPKLTETGSLHLGQYWLLWPPFQPILVLLPHFGGLDLMVRISPGIFPREINTIKKFALIRTNILSYLLVLLSIQK
jgi:hypothetical protein